MQQGSGYDYTPPYYQIPPNPNPNNPNPPALDFHHHPNPSFASAPPYSPHYPNPNANPDPPAAYPNPYHSYPPFPDPQFQPYYGSYEPPPPPPSYAPPHVAPSPPSYPSHEPQYGGGGSGSGSGGAYPDLFSDGVYAYDGGMSEPYRARGMAPRSSGGSSWTRFDDYGRSTSFASSGREQGSGAGGGSAGKVVRAVPKAEAQQDVRGGVQKFRVKLLAETAGQSTLDVLAQIGLDGIRMLEPSTNKTLRIYPLENVTRWEVLDSSIFAFWAKSPVDIEPRRIRLKSNSYTSNTILDIVTAAAFQAKEMGSASKVATVSVKSIEQPEKKKGFLDWVNSIKPANEEKDHWVPDEAVIKCTSCGADFGAFCRRHHCRNCGDIFCDKCTSGRIALTTEEQAPQVRVCDRCLAEVTQRLSRAKESVGKPAVAQTHEDLAKKLQAEMERNKKLSTGFRSSEGPGRRMREVACPTCTVHLQVQVPSSGSETIECGVCQQPFLVSAH